MLEDTVKNLLGETEKFILGKLRKAYIKGNCEKLVRRTVKNLYWGKL